jgi:hypothetical protein
MGNGSPRRVAPLLLLCLPLAACAAGGALPGEQPAPDAAAAPVLRSSGSSGGARGGATTAAARADSEPADAPADALTQARVDCWMMVVHKKELRGIDQRIAFIDKCVAGQMKSKPTP